MTDNSQTDTETGFRELSQRDVVFTPLMLRVRDVLDGADRSAPLRLRLSELHPIAEATDEWFYLRARAEQVTAEANGMTGGRGPLVDLEDEYGTGQLGFVLRCAGRSVRICMGQTGRRGWVELQRPSQPNGQRLEPEDPGVLEDLVVDLLAGTRPATTAEEGRR
jgi:hypothetical protein